MIGGMLTLNALLLQRYSNLTHGTAASVARVEVMTVECISMLSWRSIYED